MFFCSQPQPRRNGCILKSGINHNGARITTARWKWSFQTELGVIALPGNMLSNSILGTSGGKAGIMERNKLCVTKIFILFFALTLIFGFSTAFAATIRVPADQPTIQAGIDAAVDGDTVLVADGTYTGEGNQDIDFKGKAITVQSENGAENCIIDCEDYSVRGFYLYPITGYD